MFLIIGYVFFPRIFLRELVRALTDRFFFQTKVLYVNQKLRGIYDEAADGKDIVTDLVEVAAFQGIAHDSALLEYDLHHRTQGLPALPLFSLSGIIYFFIGVLRSAENILLDDSAIGLELSPFFPSSLLNFNIQTPSFPEDVPASPLSQCKCALGTNVESWKERYHAAPDGSSQSAVVDGAALH
jgi:hypothetical protein